MSSNETEAAAAGQPALGEFRPLAPTDDPAVDVRGRPTTDISREYRHLRTGSTIHLNTVYAGTVREEVTADDDHPFDDDELSYSSTVYRVEVSRPSDVDELYLASSLSWDVKAKYLTAALDDPVAVQHLTVENPTPPEGTAIDTVDRLQAVEGHRIFYTDHKPRQEAAFVHIVELDEVRDGVAYLTADSLSSTTGRTALWVVDPDAVDDGLDTSSGPVRKHALATQFAIPPSLDAPPGKYRVTSDGLLPVSLQFRDRAVPKTDFVLEAFDHVTASDVDTQWDVAQLVASDDGPAPDDDITAVTGIGEKTALRFAGANTDSHRHTRPKKARERLEQDDTVEVRELDPEEISDDLQAAQDAFEPSSDDRDRQPDLPTVASVLDGDVPLFELGQYYLRAVATVRQALLDEDPAVTDIVRVHAAATNSIIYGEDGEKLVNFPELYYHGLPSEPLIATTRSHGDYTPPLEDGNWRLFLTTVDQQLPEPDSPYVADREHFLPDSALPDEDEDYPPVPLRPLFDVPGAFEPVSHAALNLADSHVALFNLDEDPGADRGPNRALSEFTTDVAAPEANPLAGKALEDLRETHLVSVPVDLLEYAAALFGVDVVADLTAYASREPESAVIPHPEVGCELIAVKQ